MTRRDRDPDMNERDTEESVFRSEPCGCGHRRGAHIWGTVPASGACVVTGCACRAFLRNRLSKCPVPPVQGTPAPLTPAQCSPPQTRHCSFGAADRVCIPDRVSPDPPTIYSTEQQD